MIFLKVLKQLDLMTNIQEVKCGVGEIYNIGDLQHVEQTEYLEQVKQRNEGQVFEQIEGTDIVKHVKR